MKGILEKHFGKISESVDDFIQVVKDEEHYKPPGVKINQSETASGISFTVYKIGFDQEEFLEQNHFLQSLLPFFIDGASPIEASPFWQYFLLYDSKTSDLLAFATVYQAYLTAERYRAKIS